MPRDERFTFLCNPDERRLIAELAKRMHRSQSDAVRFVVFQAARSEVIEIIPANKNDGQEKSTSEIVESTLAAIKKLGNALATDSSLTDHVQSLKNMFDKIKDELDQIPN